MSHSAERFSVFFVSFGYSSGSHVCVHFSSITVPSTSQCNFNSLALVKRSPCNLSHSAERISVFFVSYLPALTMVILGGLSTFIDPKSSPARVGMGITSVLTVSTVIQGLKSQLPKVNYLTALDVYLWTCFFFVGFCLVEYAYINYKTVVLPNERKERIRKKSFHDITKKLQLDLSMERRNNKSHSSPINSEKENSSEHKSEKTIGKILNKRKSASDVFAKIALAASKSSSQQKIGSKEKSLNRNSTDRSLFSRQSIKSSGQDDLDLRDDIQIQNVKNKNPCGPTQVYTNKLNQDYILAIENSARYNQHQSDVSKSTSNNYNPDSYEQLIHNVRYDPDAVTSPNKNIETRNTCRKSRLSTLFMPVKNMSFGNLFNNLPKFNHKIPGLGQFEDNNKYDYSTSLQIDYIFRCWYVFSFVVFNLIYWTYYLFISSHSSG